MRKIGMIAGMAIPLLGLVACGSNAASENTADKSQDTVVIVSTARIAYDDGSEEKLYHADVQYVRSFKFAPQADGIATRVLIHPGQKVSEGQKLIVYPAQNHQLQVEQQQAIYKDMQGKLEKQQALLTKGFVARQTVEDLELEVKNKAKEIRIRRCRRSISEWDYPFSTIHVTILPTLTGDITCELIKCSTPLFWEIRMRSSQPNLQQAITNPSGKAV